MPMRTAPAVLLGLGLCVLAPCAFAQNPTSNRASNIDRSDTSSAIAPALPAPDLPPGSPPEAFLRAARAALATGHRAQSMKLLDQAIAMGAKGRTAQ